MPNPPAIQTGSEAGEYQPEVLQGIDGFQGDKTANLSLTSVENVSPCQKKLNELSIL